MKIIAKSSGRAYWTWDKKKYNKWRRKNRELRKERGLCQDCPREAAPSTSDHVKRITRCRDCEIKRIEYKKEKRKHAKQSNSDDSSRNPSNSQQKEQGLRAGR